MRCHETWLSGQQAAWPWDRPPRGGGGGGGAGRILPSPTPILLCKSQLGQLAQQMSPSFLQNHPRSLVIDATKVADWTLAAGEGVLGGREGGWIEDSPLNELQPWPNKRKTSTKELYGADRTLPCHDQGSKMSGMRLHVIRALNGLLLPSHTMLNRALSIEHEAHPGMAAGKQ